MRRTRRRFLECSAGAAVGTWLGPGGATGETGPPAILPFVGEGTFPLDTIIGAGLGQRRMLDLSTLARESLLTPADRFFIRTGAPDRLHLQAPWTVRVHGLVETPAEVPLAELTREADDRGPHLLECAGNARTGHFGLMSAARWTGVPLERVLRRAQALPRATRVLVSGFDEHSVVDPGSVPGASWIFGLAEVRDAGAFLATGMDGAPLRPEHGAPLRLVVPGWYACVAIKWVNEIALLDDEAPATDQMREYAGRTHQEPTVPRDRELMQGGRRPEGPPLARDFQPATIDPAAVPIRVEIQGGEGTERLYRIVGIVWGGRAPVRGLHLRLNPDLGFVPVEEMASGVPGVWDLWSHTFRSPAPGRYRIELRVVDPGVRTRRLDLGYYAREIEIPRV